VGPPPKRRRFTRVVCEPGVVTVPKDEDPDVFDLEITGALDRHAVEALRLEIRRLVERYGGRLREFREEPDR